MVAHRLATLTWLWMAFVAASSLCAASPPITAAAFAPDGQQIIVASQAGVELRDWPELSVARSLATQLTNVHDVAFSLDGKLFAVAGGSPGDEGVIEICRWPNCERVSNVVAHTDVIYKVAWRSDGLQIACASADHEVTLIDVGTARVDHRLAGHSRAVTSLAYLPGDRYLVSGSVDTTLRVWDLSTRTVTRSLTNHTADVRDVAVQPNTNADSPIIASAGADRTIRLWQPLSGRLMRFARLPSEPLDLGWTPDATQLVVSCADGHVRTIDAESVAITRDIPVAKGWAYTLAIPRDGFSAFIGAAGGMQHAVQLTPQ